MTMRRVDRPPPTSCARFSGWSLPEDLVCGNAWTSTKNCPPASGYYCMPIPNSQLFMLAGAVRNTLQ